MSFRNLNIALSYETGHDDPINEFYVPLLAKSKNYDRIAGFFTSASLAVAARGIAGLIKNNGKMRIIASPFLSKEDSDVIKRSVEFPDEYLSEKLLEDISHIEDDFQRDHLTALGWMLVNGFLEMKLAIVQGDEENTAEYDSLFHQKIGIMTDLEGNQISFSGSINETASGWLNNIEEFKVFRGWIVGQDDYLYEDISRFNDFWEGKRPNVTIKDLPEAVKNQLITVGKQFEFEHFKAKKYMLSSKTKTFNERLSLFSYQKEAFDKWKENDCRLLFEMATGTGKTRAAIACIHHFFEAESSGVAIISCPQSTLSLQWKEEIDKLGLDFDLELVADGSHRWKDILIKQLKFLNLKIFNHLIIYTTHSTASSDTFIDIIKENIGNVPVCFIGDEAHGLGAYKSKNALLDIYNYRVGLSATPSRWFDDYGSELLTKYFGDNSFQFTIAQALTTINPLTGMPFLSEYEYIPVFVSLSDEELDQYQTLTNRISKLASYSKKSDEYQKLFEYLLFERANIEKNATNKMNALNNIINNYPIENTIIFTSDSQIDEVMKLLSKSEIIAHRFTQSQGTRPEKKYNGFSERQHLIKQFKNGVYNALVAIKCLDEGVDIPSANTAIIMASSTNPREYIQRVGRVIRRAKSKSRAYIFDFVIEPDFSRIHDSEIAKFEKMIFEKELTRVRDMSSSAINNADILITVNEKLRRLMYGIK